MKILLWRCLRMLLNEYSFLNLLFILFLFTNKQNNALRWALFFIFFYFLCVVHGLDHFLFFSWWFFLILLAQISWLYSNNTDDNKNASKMQQNSKNKRNDQKMIKNSSKINKNMRKNCPRAQNNWCFLFVFYVMLDNDVLNLLELIAIK